MIRTVITLLFLISSIIYPQKKVKTDYGSIYTFNLENTAFPHALRDSGYIYKNQTYSKTEHYSDNTVLIFIPDYCEKNDTLDVVYYFHGWWNNVGASLVKFNLIEQFHSSKIKAILVLVETAKNAPDSFGGKLEEKNIFSNLTFEIVHELNGTRDNELKINRIKLAGHSGAYRVISFILENGGLTEKISSVFLFDGLYGELEKYISWLTKFEGRFINIFTPDGGTKTQSMELISILNSFNLPNTLIENDNFSVDDLKTQRIITIKSKLNHNEVIHTKNQFRKFLESSM